MSREAAIRQTHAAVTLEVLEALANKGLLRRAQKDLERGEVTAFEMGGAGLVASISGQQVTLIEAGPAKAACTCPAPGVCQHILAACLKMMEEPAEVSSASAHDEWLAFSDADLLAYYGLPTLRSAHELSCAHPAQFESGSILTVRFATLNAEVVALPGAGFAGIIVNGLNEKRHAQLAAAAFLIVRRSAGLDWEPPTNDKERSGPVHREDVVKSVAALLEEVIASGLARLSPAIVERFDALAISAQTAELHRAGLLLRRIATQSSDWLQRRPHADLCQIFREMATAYALVHASPHLAGNARESYIEVGSLDLNGVAAWPWRTPSGYEGLTLLMWDDANANWNTWSDARPRAFQGGFNAVSRYTQPGPWEGAESPAQLARSRFRVMSAKRNRWGRLSSSEQSKVLVTGLADLQRIPAIDDWTGLDDKIRAAIGLREQDPRSAYQLVRPAVWERQPFDPISQSLMWVLRDKEGHALLMRLPYDELTMPAIKTLEMHRADEFDGSSLLGRCIRVGGQVQIYPLALLKEQRVISLFLGSVVATGASKSTISAPSDDEEQDETELAQAPLGVTPLSQLVLASISSAEWLAETGSGGRCAEARSRLNELSAQARQLGLASIAEHLRLNANNAASGSVLRLRWMLGVMQRATS